MTSYIQQQWQDLRRNAVSARALRDTKSTRPSVLYVPKLIEASLPAHLAAVPLGPTSSALTMAPGLLYLPKDFVVPGGRFNEQYGWDTYFTVRGLLQDGKTELARDMVDNQLFEVDHYGKVLNANRSYYLGRSSPPFLSRSVIEVYKRTGDQAWLAQALSGILHEHDTWRDPGEYGHLTANGLSRYASDVGAPCPEVEPGYYDHRPHDPQFYRNDRAERESGWDMTDRFGYHCMDYNPVDLNCLLYQDEKDIAQIYRILDGDRSPAATAWEQRSQDRRQKIQDLMWDDKHGMFYDYDVATGHRSDYASMATFMPLWTGVATPEQAKRVRDNLPLFEHQGGLAVSARVSGKQWDAPYGWAPLTMIAAEGLRRYGYDADAHRIEGRFLACAAKVFEKQGTLLEKYNVVEGSANADVGYGNQVGFGWTNAAVRVFTEDLRHRAEDVSCHAQPGPGGGRPSP